MDEIEGKSSPKSVLPALRVRLSAGQEGKGMEGDGRVREKDGSILGGRTTKGGERGGERKPA